MNTKDLEDLLEGAEETDRLEFKGPMEWNRHSLIKDILAMSNVQGGGKIIFGIVDGTFARLGLSEDEQRSFRSDLIKDQVAPFADPPIRLRVHWVSDQSGLRFVVIDVHEFEEFPTICRRDGTEVRKGEIYFRSLASKPQSARVSEASDLRQIIERAVAKRMHTLTKLGFGTQAGDSVSEWLDAELGGL